MSDVQLVPAVPRLVPELEVSDLAVSLAFYVERVGFVLSYGRAAEGFAYLTLGGADLMLEQVSTSLRRFTTAPLERPFGRGMNLQIQVPDAAALLRRLAPQDDELRIPLEDRWYDVGEHQAGNRQFVISDPDGYLLRFFNDLGERKPPTLARLPMPIRNGSAGRRLRRVSLWVGWCSSL